MKWSLEAVLILLPIAVGFIFAATGIEPTGIGAVCLGAICWPIAFIVIMKKHGHESVLPNSKSEAKSIWKSIGICALVALAFILFAMMTSSQ